MGSYNKRQVGAEYEKRAEQFLCKEGILILERNFRCRQGEIDLIGKHQNCLVFVEVKYRSSNQAGLPEEAVGIAKQKRICRVAEFYLYTHQQYGNCMIRYDVVAIAGNQLRWYPDAFEHVRG